MSVRMAGAGKRSGAGGEANRGENHQRVRGFVRHDGSAAKASARLTTANPIAPTKKPSCIAPVIQAAPVADSSQRSISDGNTAVAENRNGTTQRTATTNSPILAVSGHTTA